MHLSLATGYVNLGEKEKAEQHFELARRYIWVLEDFSTDLVIQYDEGRLALNLGDLDGAVQVFKKLLVTSRDARPLLHRAVSLMMIWGCYLTGVTAELPEWGKEYLQGLKSFEKVEVEAPYDVIEVVLQAFVLLRNLGDHWQKHLPVYTVREHKAERDLLVQQILELKNEAQDEISEFFLGVCRALAYSLQGSKNAFDVLDQLEGSTVSRIKMLNCLRCMVIIQVHANLPKVKNERLADTVLEARRLFLQMSEFEKNWLLDWGKRYLPYSLWVLSCMVSDGRVQDIVQDYLMIGRKGWVRFKGKHLKRYPKKFILDNVVELLHGKALDEDDLDQARRHLNALKSINVTIPGIIYMPVLRELEPKMNCNLFER